MKGIPLLLAIILFSAQLVNSQIPEDYSFKQNYKIANPATMSVTINDGFIKTYSANTNDIQVYFMVMKNNKLMKMTLEDLEDELDVEISNSSNHLEVSIKQNASDWVTNWKDRYIVSLQIIAPKDLSCDLHTSDGNIEILDLQGDQICRTSDGDIKAERVSGSLNARTSDGNIEIIDINGPVETQTSDGDIVASQVAGDCNLRTSDGNIECFTIEGDIHAVTSDGDINIDKTLGNHELNTSDGNIVIENFSGGLSAQTSDGDIIGIFTDLKHKIYLKTSDGNITATIPNNLGLNLTLKGEEIHTKLDNFNGTTSEHTVEGTVRGGGVEVDLISSDGDVTLNYR